MAKRATTKDIAELAGVSRTTVSFVLNDTPGMRIPEDTRQRVLEAARQLNYYPHAGARSMVSGRTNTIGFVLRQSADQAFADQFLPQVLEGLTKATGTLGYRILFEAIPPDAQSDAYAQLIHEQHVDGIVLSGPRFDDQELLRIFAEGAHIVLLGQLPNTGIPFVDVDNVGGAALAAQHLIRLGHTRIGLITNAPLIYTASSDRLAGYRHALEAAGIAYDETLVRHGDFSPHGGEIAMNDLLDLHPRPSAVFVASDTVALGALQALRKHNLRVPENMAVVGFDDIPLVGFIDPPLTTVRLPAHDLGWHAAQRLVDLITNRASNNGDNILLETSLIVRQSCGAHIAKHSD